ncbi:endoplasmic reticulum-resident kdel protein [Purpureocillium lilacinum]|nr:endoplasmic reticulum-resident kdel protein [Purpureocillium lilacinum]
MAKMLGTGPFSRRPSGLTRYVAVAVFLLVALYFFSSSSDSYTSPGASLERPVNPASPQPGEMIKPDDRPKPDAGKPGSQPPADKPKTQPDTSKQEKPDAKKPDTQKAGDKPKTAPPASEPGRKKHPIDKLIYDAQHHFAELTSKESKTVEQAAQAYRKQRGRHPPPGFDKWFAFARSHNALVVEDFFDQIHHDIEPFWGLDPALMRREASQFEMTINVRNGNATAGSDWFWTKIWLNLVQEIAPLLPDMDLALNAMDEPRLVVPWEDMQGFMQKAAKTVKLPKAKTVVSEFQKLPEPRKGNLAGEIQQKSWEQTKPYWPVARRGCPPSSAARTAPLQESFADPPSINTKHAEPHLYKGFVSNYTLSNELCHQPDLQGLEGILIAPLSTSATKTMFPMFGGSKLTVNNEILLPAPMYWNEEERFTGGDDHGVEWREKHNKAIWRGVATGGLNRADNWRGFQRHRFIAMGNGTKVALVEAGEKPENFALAEEQYGVSAQRDGKLGEWLNEWSDVGFIDLSCDPPQKGRCNYTDFYFHPVKGLKMAEQFGSKYLPDIDGNSFSGRYLGFLRSTSLPIKSTIWREWHDSRLVPWKHFVPMDNRFTDYYGIMEYFLGYQGRDGHDHAAEKMASEGKEWAEQVLRKEDMLVYVLRLLLEYARVVDERRETMGWVDDVLRNPSLESTWKSWWRFGGS